jgi:ABC-type uncharacterized transport system fused permease/ATPase subunit
VRSRGGGVVSIAHRPALDGFHEKQWEIVEAGAGAGGAAYRLSAHPVPKS